MNYPTQAISVIGLGKLGLPLCAALASRGHRVVGIDQDPGKIEKYTGNRFFFEPGMDELLDKNRSSIEFCSDYARALDTSLTFVIVPTPSLPNGDFSLEYLQPALNKLGEVLRQKKDFHIVSIVSTVLPGSMEILKQVLEEASQKKCGEEFGLCYNPAFIALGNVIANFLRPDFVLLGESDEATGAVMESFYSGFCTGPVPVRRMNFINAELAKIAVNTFVTMKISFGNVLARLCEKLPGADAEAVTGALGEDSRIGPRYLKGALGYGGPCFPRDNKAFAYVARKAGFPALNAQATDEINNLQIPWLTEALSAYLSPDDVVGVLGLSYKAETDVIEASQGVELAKTLSGKYKVIVYDPAAMANAAGVLNDNVTYAKSHEELLESSTVAIITSPWKQFCEAPDHVWNNGRLRLLIDCWGILKSRKLPEQLQYIVLGKTLPVQDCSAMETAP